MTSPNPLQLSAAPTRPGRLWVWFLAGFLIVFVGMLLFAKTYDLLPSGRGVVQISLWQYYELRLPKMFAAQPLGSGARGPSGVITTLFQHVISAALGGFVGLAIGWKVQKRRQRRTGA
jgi:ABC-type Fe3+ transport system permease subunit